jgi:cell division protein FtsQ
MNGQAPVLRLLGWCVALFLIAGALLPLVPRLTSPGAPLVLEISGEFVHVRPETVRSALTEQLLVDFYRLDLGAVKAVVESLPWVATARVDRAWPGTVRVHVQEHTPYARWGEYALLSESGAVFTPLVKDLPEGLPQLAGPDGQQSALREAFEILKQQLAGTPFVPRSLARDARGEWTAVTADGIELKLGRGAPLEAAEHAVTILGGPVRMALEGRLQEVAYVDLHYINGFAVGWRSGRAGDAIGAAPLAQGRND